MNKRFAPLLATTLLLCAGITQAQDPKRGVRYYGNIPLSAMPGLPPLGAGCTGWVSPGGREYAIMGVQNGTSIIDVTNPTAPELLAHIPAPNSVWHENVVVDGYAYLVTDNGGPGLQIVDMRFIDTTRVATLVATYTGNGLHSAHTIQYNSTSDTLMLNGSNRGLLFLSITNRTAPVEVGAWAGAYVHDSETVTYTEGPYAGRELSFICCGTGGLRVLDVTNKSAAIVLGSNQYLPASTYCHSGVLTPDKKYFLVNDEFDEQGGQVPSCTTHIFDVQDPTQPTHVGVFNAGGNFIDHNSRLVDGNLVLAAYRGGIRIYDARNPLAMRETGFYDSHPGSGASYDGAWGTYIFPSGTAIIADRQRGLLTVDPTEAMGLGAVPVTQTIEKGSLVSGSLKNLRKADDSPVVLQGYTGPASRNTFGIAAVYGFDTTNLPSTKLDVAFEGHVADVGAADVNVYLKNWTTGLWTKIGPWSASNTDVSHVAVDLPAGTYVNGAGRIEVRIESLVVVRTLSQTFKTYIDQLKVSLHN